MNKRKTILIGSIILTLGLLSCGEKKQSPISADNSNSWKTISADNYTITYPPTWTLDNSGRMGMTLQLFSPLSSPEDKFSDNVNLVIQNLTGQPIKSLDQYTELSENQILTMLTDSKILSSERLKSNGQEYQKVSYTAQQGIYKLTFQQYFFIKNEMAYVLTFTCVADEFEKYRAIGDKILNSFRIK